MTELRNGLGNRRWRWAPCAVAAGVLTAVLPASSAAGATGQVHVFSGEGLDAADDFNDVSTDGGDRPGTTPSSFRRSRRTAPISGTQWISSDANSGQDRPNSSTLFRRGFRLRAGITYVDGNALPRLGQRGGGDVQRDDGPRAGRPVRSGEPVGGPVVRGPRRTWPPRARTSSSSPCPTSTGPGTRLRRPPRVLAGRGRPPGAHRAGRHHGGGGQRVRDRRVLRGHGGGRQRVRRSS